MSDEYPPVYPQHALRITAAYPASDGRVPESMEVEVGFELVDHVTSDPHFIDRTVQALARVAGDRHREPHITFAAGGPIPFPGHDIDTLRRAIEREHAGAVTAVTATNVASAGTPALDLDTIGGPDGRNGGAAQ